MAHRRKTLRVGEGEFKIKFFTTTYAEVSGRNKEGGFDHLFTGSVTLNPKDEFNPIIGNKLALAKVLRSMTENKEYRREFWKQAFKKGVVKITPP